ncbi:endonuclease/exonuclease/phosphatase family protein [Microbacterium sp. NPDC057650]|uniref:endonuclease/exonuclease/phosphatase family protein n=1 Tax=unclassified Microbacterium TaxID=2609290 RepID=UPI00366C23C5
MKRLPSLLTFGIAAAGIAALGSAPAIAATPPASDAAQRTITVASYNIHHGEGPDGVVDLERVAQTLESTDAKVIGLQEVDRHFGARSGYVDQAAWLAQRLGMSYCYSVNLDFDPAPGQTERSQYGTAILSSYPLKDCQNTPLPLLPGEEQRGLAQADVLIRGVELRYFNTHLTHQSEQGRLDQAAVFTEKAQDAEAAGMPVVLTGDLNAEPDSPEYDVYTRVLSDAWAAVGDGPGYTFDSDNPIGRIDYVLTSDDVTPIAAKVVPSLASDHLPVVTEVRLPHPSSNGQGRR